jgi:hypothetical protein
MVQKEKKSVKNDSSSYKLKEINRKQHLFRKVSLTQYNNNLKETVLGTKWRSSETACL